MTIDTKQTVTVAQVDVKSAWLSKINWTQAVGLTASALVFMTGGKINIPVDVQAEIVLGIQAIQSIATWVMKTWFTTTITESSATGPDVPTKEIKK